MTGVVMAVSTTLRRQIWRGVGYGFVALGAVGIALPVLPTTGPGIVGVWCLLKGGDPLAQRLLAHPRFGAALKAWFEGGRISRKGKVFATLGMAGAVAFAGLFGLTGLALAAPAILLSAVSLWLWRRPEG